MKHWVALYSALFSMSALALPCDQLSVLENIFTASNESVSLETISTNLRSMDNQLIKDTQSGKTFDYWVDSQNQIRFSDVGHLPKDDSAFIVLKDASSKDGFVIKEWGNFHFDPVEKKFVFKPKNSWDLQPGEIDDAIKSHSNINYLREADPALQKSQVIKCTDVLAAQERGDAFIKDSMMISGFVTAAGFVTANPEFLNVKVHDKDWQKKALLLASDLTGNLASSYISSKVVKPLLTQKVSILKDFAQRTATDLATNAVIKRPLYNAVNSEKNASGEKTNLGNKLLPYDTGFGFVRFFPKRAVQKWTLQSIPKLLLSSCLKDSKLNLIVGPRMVRIADQYVAGYFYMLGRKAWLNQTSDVKTEGNKK